MSYGFTTVEDTNDSITICHSGNMGDTIDSVNANLKHMGLPYIETLKKYSFGWTETGSPDYWYEFVTRITP